MWTACSRHNHETARWLASLPFVAIGWALYGAAWRLAQIADIVFQFSDHVAGERERGMETMRQR
jgi:hypothetical protein